MRTMVSGSTARRSVHARRCLGVGLVAAAISFIVTAGLAQAPPRGPDEPADDVVARVHRAALTIDPHIDIRDDFNTAGNDAASETMGQLDLPKLERGGLDVATVALFADPKARTPDNIAAARRQIDSKLSAIRQLLQQHPRLDCGIRCCNLAIPHLRYFLHTPIPKRCEFCLR